MSVPTRGRAGCKNKTNNQQIAVLAHRQYFRGGIKSESQVNPSSYLNANDSPTIHPPTNQPPNVSLDYHSSPGGSYLSHYWALTIKKSDITLFGWIYRDSRYFRLREEEGRTVRSGGGGILGGNPIVSFYLQTSTWLCKFQPDKLLRPA